MNGCHNYLFSKGIANDKNVSFYIMWSQKYLEFQKSSTKKDATNSNIEYFIRGLSKKYSDWQITYTNETVQVQACSLF